MKHAAAVKDWWWNEMLRALFRFKATHLRVETNVVFGRANSQDLKLDIVMPKTGGPFPTLLIIPGGGWIWIAQPDTMHILDEMLAEHGFVTAQVTYRLAPRDRYPAMLEDCKAAVRFLRANATQFQIDPDRIGTLGFSSGAQLACLLGETNPDDGFEGDGNREQSSRVGAVVAFFPPTDFTEPVWLHRFEKKVMIPALGATYAERPDLYQRASPVNYVRPGAPPHLFFHGTADDIVGIIHSRMLSSKLHAVGASARLVELPGLGHGAWPRGRFNPCLEDAIRFFKENLRPAARDVTTT
jgi:acetyl esterase/lipase